MPGEFIELSHFALDPASIRLLSRAFCENNRVVVLDKVDPKSSDPVRVGMLDTTVTSTIESIVRALGRSIRPVQLNAYEVQKALDAGFTEGSLKREGVLEIDAVDKLTFRGDIPQVVSEILGRAVAIGASDVHIEAHDDDVDVRWRIDGVLYQITHPIGASELRRVMARLKVLASLDIAETRAVQEGRIQAIYAGKRPVDFRLSILPGPYGEDAVLRVLESSKQISELTALGLSPQQATLLGDLVDSPEGLVLTTGPTGSGKTTTLYSLLAELTDKPIKILTAEDPIEYRLAKINQKQITHKIDFADYARAFLRQDPDVMMIGEIRDDDTAEVAVRAAQTGHLVLSTLHTSDSVSAIRRLTTLGVESENISATLLCVIAQRLVRKICGECRVDHELDAAEVRVFPRGFARTFRGKGCDACMGRGLKGRTGIYEIFAPDEDLSEMIAREEPVHVIRARARARGMAVLFEEGARKVEEGVTTVGELKGALSYRIIREYAG